MCRNPTAPTYTEQVINDTAKRVSQTFRKRIVSLEAQVERLQSDRIIIEIRQQDWIPGFAAFVDDEDSPESNPNPQGPYHILLNLGAGLCAVEAGDMPKAELPYHVAESLMHEIMHVLEKWAGIEFNEDRVEGLLAKYREYVKAKMQITGE